MNIFVGQIYVEPGASFPFSIFFQQYLSRVLTSSVSASQCFQEKYGKDWSLTFRMSAKQRLGENQIVGPTVYRKGKSVEYSIFLPHSVITSQVDPHKSAMVYLFSGIKSVLESLEINALILQEQEANIIGAVIGNPLMITEPA